MLKKFIIILLLLIAVNLLFYYLIPPVLTKEGMNFSYDGALSEEDKKNGSISIYKK